MVAPLIFRKHAAIVGPNNSVLTVVHDDQGQFIDECAQYTLWEGHTESVEKELFTNVHKRLVPLGSHIKVKNSAVEQFGITVSDANADWIVGCLRYPDGPLTSEEERVRNSIYVIVKVKASAAEGAALDVRLIYVSVKDCMMPSEHENNSRMSEVENRDLVSVLVPNA